MASEDRSRVAHGSGYPAMAGGSSRSSGDRERAAGLSPARDAGLSPARDAHLSSARGASLSSARDADQLDGPAAPLPRHLAVTRRAPRPTQVRSVVFAGLLLVAVVALGVTAVFQAVQRSGVPGLRKAPAAAAPSQTTVASTSGGLPSTLGLRAQPPVAGQPLVRDGGFETGRGRIRDRPGTRCQRVHGGASGQWALLLRATGGGPGPPGMWLDLAHAPALGSRWRATVMVRGRPGLAAEVRLYERKDGQVIVNRTEYLLRDTDWHRIAVERAVERPGSVLGVDVRVRGLRSGQAIAVDDLWATRLA